MHRSCLNSVLTMILPNGAMSAQISNIHDAFFKQVLSDPELAGTFLREHLPPEVASLLGPETPELIPGSFVDEELRQHHSDLLFRVHLNTREDAFVYVLLEHKSSPDPGARLQLLRYIVRLLIRWHSENKQQLPLPPVLPLLAHQGPERWKVSYEFTDLFGSVPEALRPYLPSFRHAFVDLGPMEDRSLSDKVRLRAFLKALKYGRREDLPERLCVVLAEAPALDDKDLLVILTYLNKSPIMMDSKLMQETLERLMPERKVEFTGWFSQPYYEKGLAEGEAKGEARLLSRVLEKRFGELPGSVRQRISAADVASIDAWVERVLDAPDLQSVFESTAADIS